MSVSKPRILVIRGGAIGDFILTLPAIAALRKQFPRAHLEVLGYPHIARLAVAGGLVDRVQPIEARGLAGFFARDGSSASRRRNSSGRACGSTEGSSASDMRFSARLAMARSPSSTYSTC